MSAKMIISQTEADTGFSLLKDIVEMVKNPKVIDEAYARRQKAAQLTDDEVNKAAEARSFISQSDALKEEIRKREDALVLAKADHEKKVLLDNQKIESGHIKLMEWESRLNIISDNHTKAEQRHIAANIALDARSKEIEDNHVVWENDYKKRLSDAKAIENANTAESIRLADISVKQKAKASRLAQEAAKDD